MAIRPTFYGLEIGRSGLVVSQKGLDVTGHNISNVDTAGYTRQRLVNTAYDPYNAITKFKPVDNALIGAGAYVLIHDQIRSKYLDLQFRNEQSLYSNWAIRNQMLSYIESLYEGTELSEISDSLLSMFESWNNVAETPEDGAQRKELISSSENFVESLNLLYDRLIEQQDSYDIAVSAAVDRVNSIVESIRDLNKVIYSYEFTDSRYKANDLRDKRNLLIDELSTYIDIEYEEYQNDPDDPLDVRLRITVGGDTLIDHLDYNELECVEVANTIAGENDVFEVRWATGATNGAAGDPVTITGGELRGYLDMRDSADGDYPGVPYFIEQLNNLARAVAQEINNLHVTGFTHPSSPDGSVSGVYFFDNGNNNPDVNLITAKNISLSEKIKESEFNIAASSIKVILDPDAPGFDSETLVNGDNKIAMAINALWEKTGISLTLTSGAVPIDKFADYITGLSLEVGLAKNHSQDRTDTLKVQLLNIDNQRTSISGVSLDEEMTNLIKYQHAYNGAARVITAMDDALDVIINRMGRVGL